jgi:two-component system, LytTR family, sensor kinase
MTRDLYLRLFCIPLPGLMLPMASGIITYEQYTLLQLIVANIFFVLTSFIIWTGCVWLHRRCRTLFKANANPLFKISIISLVNILYGLSTGLFSLWIWYAVSGEIYHRLHAMQFFILCIPVIVLFTFLYEILYLTKEREIDWKRVNEMGRELSQAELLALTNEMDPHFVFNSLNAMNHLILSNPMQAHLFNNNLSRVFKYFLLNKNKELIPLQDELDFIESYFYLLEIRYEKKLRLQTVLGNNYSSVRIPPCALQILIENAIKHNEFSETNPLTIKIWLNGQYLKVSNNNKPKPYSVNSTHIGLKNLSSRFRLICHRDIIIENNKESFVVKLPLITEI